MAAVEMCLATGSQANTARINSNKTTENMFMLGKYTTAAVYYSTDCQYTKG